MFPAPSNTVQGVDLAMLIIVGTGVILLLGITATMIYFVFKYNRKKGHKPEDIHGSMLLEAIWIAIPTLLVLGMFYFGYAGFEEIRNVPDNAFVINVNAKMWEWDFKYKNGKETDTLYVPVNTPIKLDMISLDVNHSLFIPAFRIKEDLIASMKTYLSFTPQQVGSYDIACAEYCGLKHSMMYTKVVVMTKEEFDNWYNEGEDVQRESVPKGQAGIGQ
ncbi:MAG: cytochrome c oxidase subunit II [Ignavibacteria bacterium]|jgi:cytochrome c oxidase subunit 2